jgi:endonuclease-3
MVSNRKRCETYFPEEIWNDLHLQIIWYGREYPPARGWDLERYYYAYYRKKISFE